MSSVQQIRISLRVFGNGLNPDEISDSLKISHSDTSLAGNTISDNNLLIKTESTGKWLRSLPRQNVNDIDYHIMSFLSCFTNDFNVWQKLTSQFRADLFCGIFLHELNEGLCMKPATLCAIGSRNLLLDFDIYALKPNQDFSCV